MCGGGGGEQKRETHMGHRHRPWRLRSRPAGSLACLSGAQLGASPGSEPLGEMGSGNLRPCAAMPRLAPHTQARPLTPGGGGGMLCSALLGALPVTPGRHRCVGGGGGMKRRILRFCTPTGHRYTIIAHQLEFAALSSRQMFLGLSGPPIRLPRSRLAHNYPGNLGCLGEIRSGSHSSSDTSSSAILDPPDKSTEPQETHG